MKALKPLSELISLEGKRALITGSAVGIGRAMAYRFAEAGADLELVDMNKRGLGLVRNELSRLGLEIDIYKVDLSKEAEIGALWEELSGKEPDILVNNAGIYPFKNFLEIDDAFLSKVLAINLKSAFLMCQHMIRRRLKRGGVIINISSIEAILPFAEDLVPYDISKIGVIAMTRALAKQYGRNGFRINVIIPGGIRTPGTTAVAKDISRFNVGLVKTGVQFAVVLASDLSSYVHGALIPVDGGFLSA
jgi:NAD(P)-dependent dehydrogenase (short-subunit alcohol dehydrogenase family)